MQLRRILLVDDNSINLQILEELLSGDYATMSVESGELAQDVAPKFLPELVLLDIMMPGIDGYDTCRWIRRHPELSNTKVIFISAKASEADIAFGMKTGADDYVTKPFNHQQLLDLVQSHLSSC